MRTTHTASSSVTLLKGTACHTYAVGAYFWELAAHGFVQLMRVLGVIGIVRDAGELVTERRREHTDRRESPTMSCYAVRRSRCTMRRSEDSSCHPDAEDCIPPCRYRWGRVHTRAASGPPSSMSGPPVRQETGRKVRVDWT
jgi:hypothetical protein